METLIIDNHELYRSALAELLQSSIPEISSVTNADSAGEVMAIAAAAPDISLILVSPEALSLGRAEALEIVRRLFKDGTIILIEDAHPGPGEPAETALVDGVIDRTDSADSVIALVSGKLSLDAAAQESGDGGPGEKAPGKDGSGAAQLSADRATAGVGRITRRQRQVMGMVSEGLPNKEIAARLGIAEGTVKAHVHTLFRTLGTTNRTQAALAYVGMMGSGPLSPGRGPELAI